MKRHCPTCLKERPLAGGIFCGNYCEWVYKEKHLDIQTRVMRDLEKRRRDGITSYGIALFPNNGRDALQDAYEEALDLACYLKQAIIERDSAN